MYLNCISSLAIPVQDEKWNPAQTPNFAYTSEKKLYIMLPQLHKRGNFIMSEPFHRLLVWKVQTSNYQILQVPITSKFNDKYQ